MPKAVTTKEKEAAALAAQEKEAALLAGGGASEGGVSEAPKNIANYFEVRFQNMMKQIQEEFKRQGSLCEHLKDQVSTSVDDYQVTTDKIMDRVEHKKSVTDVDLAVVKKKVRQLPASGDIERFFEERNVNETAAATLTFYGEDSLDSSFHNIKTDVERPIFKLGLPNFEYNCFLCNEK